ncbi:MAG: alanyl-tRNA editing protein [Candidatus Woesearchaeota archaeon]
MWMDQALYLKDNYQKEFETKVKSVNNGKFVVLEKTLFYPNSGGQPHDTGILTDEKGNEYDVVYTGKFNGDISHEVSKEGLKEGMTVKGKIDWERRYNFMRYHTASHLISGLVYNHEDAIITGNQIKDKKDEARIDFNIDEFNKEFFEMIEKKANKLIKEGKKVDKELISKEEAKKIPNLIKIAKGLPDKIKEIRVVEIEDLDIQPCGGCHLDNISEIGTIDIFKLKNKGSDNRRVYFKVKKK